jgi:hypothetical protein
MKRVETIFRRLIRKAISRAANLTPGVYYYSSNLEALINGKLSSHALYRDGEATPVATGAMALCCGLQEALSEVGSTATVRLTGVTYDDRGVGHFIVTAKRVSEDEADA